jgi:hypothetical protein
MSTTLEEETILVVDDGDVDDFFCHVYDMLSGEVAKCGLHASQDKHWLMHKGYGHSPVPLLKGTTKCTRCEAPICPKCLSLCG